jgi:hypothetical protein
MQTLSQDKPPEEVSKVASSPNAGFSANAAVTMAP